MKPPLCIPLLPLESGLLAIVDADDFWPLAEYEWRLLSGYVFTNAYRYDRNGGSIIYMHRAIAGAKGYYDGVDHINGNKLDNRRSNLRICSRSRNRANSRKCRTFNGRPVSSRFRGVTLWRGRWQAQIGLPNYGGTKKLGAFAIEEDAAFAYDEAARRLYGEFARLNFPRDNEQCALR